MDDRAETGRPYRGLGWVVTFVAGSLAAACSGPEAAPLASSQAISGGVADVSHRSVFLLISHQDRYASSCTATLLAPNLLLTARHCVSPGSHDDVLCGEAALGEPYPPSAFITTNDPMPREGSAFFRARDVRVPVESGDTCGYDIALLLLSENVSAELAEPAVPRIDREVQPGETYTAVGYGVNEVGQSTGTRMERSGLSIACQPGSCGSGVESTEFRGEDGICSGDSGGPALDADGKVVGVVSRGGVDCGTPIYGTVTAWRDFIVSTAEEAAELGSYEPAFWVTTGSSDPPVVVEPGEATGGAPSEPPRAGEGESCAEAKCEDGLACYTVSKDRSDASCVRACSTTADCDQGLICERAAGTDGAGICVEPSRGVDEHGCSLKVPGHRRAGFAWLVLGALALLTRKARR